ncbi:hypothetical protein M1D88_09780 [Arthrobacter sp. R1-13]
MTIAVHPVVLREDFIRGELLEPFRRPGALLEGLRCKDRGQRSAAPAIRHPAAKTRAVFCLHLRGQPPPARKPAFVVIDLQFGAAGQAGPW